MLMWRKMLVLLTIVGAVALLGPAAALASGPSAGDQQYVDPLGGSHSSSGSHHSSGGSQSPTQTGPSSQPTAPATTPSSSATVSSSITTTTASATPTATTATSSTAAADPPKSLPRTGFDAWLAVVIGVFMLGSGLLLRRAFRATNATH